MVKIKDEFFDLFITVNASWPMGWKWKILVIFHNYLPALSFNYGWNMLEMVEKIIDIF